MKKSGQLINFKLVGLQKTQLFLLCSIFYMFVYHFRVKHPQSITNVAVPQMTSRGWFQKGAIY